MTSPCPQRHLHATTLTDAMRTLGLQLHRCACGLFAAVKPKPERN